MSWEPQGLIKYECRACYKRFIIGLIDDEEHKNSPLRCPFCQGRPEWSALIDPKEENENAEWLDEMGCVGIYYDPEQHKEEKGCK